MAVVGKGRGRIGKKEMKEEVLALSGTDSEDSDGEGGEEDEEQAGWGSRKKHYYGGNTGEEMEEDVGESDLEEDRAEEVEASKLQIAGLAGCLEAGWPRINRRLDDW